MGFTYLAFVSDYRTVSSLMIWCLFEIPYGDFLKMVVNALNDSK